MPLFIQSFGITSWEVSAFTRRDAGRYSFGFERGAEFVAVISFIAKQMGSALRQCRVKQLGSDMITHIPLTQAHNDRATLTIADGV